MWATLKCFNYLKENKFILPIPQVYNIEPYNRSYQFIYCRSHTMYSNQTKRNYVISTTSDANYNQTSSPIESYSTTTNNHCGFCVSCKSYTQWNTWNWNLLNRALNMSPAVVYCVFARLFFFSSLFFLRLCSGRLLVICCQTSFG